MSDTETFLIGGSGFDRRYLVSLKTAMKGSGFTDVEILNHFQPGLLPAGVTAFFEQSLPVVWKDPRVLAAAKSGAAINLVGYSWGALCAVAIALDLARAGAKVAHLVLVGAPLGARMLKACRQNPLIGAVHVIDLPGDPVRAGNSLSARIGAVIRLPSQYPDKRGHFCYVASDAAGDAARQRLAEKLAALLARD